MWCQECRLAIRAKMTNALCDLEPRDAQRDFNAAPIAGRGSWHHISLSTLWRCHG